MPDCALVPKLFLEANLAISSTVHKTLNLPQTLKSKHDITCEREVIWMPMAYILISTEEFDLQLMNTLRKIKGVEEAYPLYGVYDIIAKTRANTMDGIKEIHNKIRRLQKIKQTLTMIAHEE